MFIFSNQVTEKHTRHHAWWRFGKISKYSAVCSKKRAKNHTAKSRIYISCSEEQFGECFCVYARRKKKAVNVYFQKIIFWNILPLKYYFSTCVHFNCLKFLLCCHTVFGTPFLIRDLIRYIFLFKLSHKCANLHLVNVKLIFCKPWMKHKLVFEVYHRNILLTCWF